MCEEVIHLQAIAHFGTQNVVPACWGPKLVVMEGGLEEVFGDGHLRRDGGPRDRAPAPCHVSGVPEAHPLMPDFPRKPAFGDPCNGCGVCCVACPCPLALDHVTGAVLGQPCPALEWSEGRSWCGMVRDPGRYDATAAAMIGLGVGSREALGAVFRKMLGGDWGCDSGAEPGTVDEDVGLTAIEYAHLVALGLR